MEKDASVTIYMLRDKATGEWINKKYKSTNRIYETPRHAASAATFLAEDMWGRTHDKPWWRLSPNERRIYRESVIEIVKLEAREA